jgi:hypothetical protein
MKYNFVDPPTNGLEIWKIKIVQNTLEWERFYSKELEEQNKQMLEALIKLHRDKCCCIDCDLYNHALDKETTEFIKSITKK